MSSQVSYKGRIDKVDDWKQPQSVTRTMPVVEEDGNDAVVGGLGDHYDHGDEVNDQIMLN